MSLILVILLPLQQVLYDLMEGLSTPSVAWLYSAAASLAVLMGSGWLSKASTLDKGLTRTSISSYSHNEYISILLGSGISPLLFFLGLRLTPLTDQIIIYSLYPIICSFIFREKAQVSNLLALAVIAAVWLSFVYQVIGIPDFHTGQIYLLSSILFLVGHKWFQRRAFQAGESTPHSFTLKSVIAAIVFSFAYYVAINGVPNINFLIEVQAQGFTLVLIALVIASTQILSSYLRNKTFSEHGFQKLLLPHLISIILCFSLSKLMFENEVDGGVFVYLGLYSTSILIFLAAFIAAFGYTLGEDSLIQRAVFSALLVFGSIYLNQSALTNYDFTVSDEGPVFGKVLTSDRNLTRINIQDRTENKVLINAVMFTANEEVKLIEGPKKKLLLKLNDGTVVQYSLIETFNEVAALYQSSSGLYVVKKLSEFEVNHLKDIEQVLVELRDNVSSKGIEIVVPSLYESEDGANYQATPFYDWPTLADTFSLKQRINLKDSIFNWSSGMSELKEVMKKLVIMESAAIELGYSNRDIHSNNVLISPSSQKIAVVDFDHFLDIPSSWAYSPIASFGMKSSLYSILSLPRISSVGERKASIASLAPLSIQFPACDDSGLSSDHYYGLLARVRKIEHQLWLSDRGNYRADISALMKRLTPAIEGIQCI